MFGEGQGGCTADDSFFETAQYALDEDFLACFVHYKQWKGVHDMPQLYYRPSEKKCSGATNGSSGFKGKKAKAAMTFFC